jgi:hypothetical protein
MSMNAPDTGRRSARMPAAVDWSAFVAEVVVAFNAWQAAALRELFADPLASFGRSDAEDRLESRDACDQAALGEPGQRYRAYGATDGPPWLLLREAGAFYCEAEDWAAKAIGDGHALLTIRLRLYAQSGALLGSRKLCWLVQAAGCADSPQVLAQLRCEPDPPG